MMYLVAMTVLLSLVARVTLREATGKDFRRHVGNFRDAQKVCQGERAELIFVVGIV